MKTAEKTAPAPQMSKPRQAIHAIKNSKSYADIQHFYKSKLQYSNLSEKDSEKSFVLGYN